MNSKNFRAPAVPLIAHDPFFSVWSCADNLNDSVTRHWTGVRQSMFGVLVCDGKIYEFLGKVGYNEEYYFTGYNKMKQISCEVRPMTSIYTFENDVCTLEVKFTSPLLLNDLEILSRPISYITYKITPKDKKEHNFDVQFGFSSEFCVNQLNQTVTVNVTPLSVYFSSGDELMLKRSADDQRIEWGELHVIAPDYTQECKPIRVYQNDLEVEYGSKLFPINCLNSQGPRRECQGPAVINPFEVNTVYPYYPTIIIGKKFTLKGKTFESHFGVGYNDFKSIQYFGENIDAYYKKNGDDFYTVMGKSIDEYDEIMAKVNAFEEDLIKRASKISKKYADIVSLAYRQVIAGHKLTYHNGEIQFSSKENYSNGCIATVDVTYPSIPLFLIYEPRLVEGMLNPIFKMIDEGLWHYDFAPHDVGQYPIANGQVYGYILRTRRKRPDPYNSQMPVEECGNMILCVAALCFAEKDTTYFEKHEAILRKWADYLVKVGYNPDNQLCTDDFAGHLAHNVNLSAKAICALGAIAKLYKEVGNEKLFEKYDKIARDYAKQLEENARDKNGYRLAFDMEGTWSLKYNMVWDKLFGMNLFPEKLYEKELECYKKNVEEYGIRLDNRSETTKTDWQMWSTMLFDDKEYTNMVVNAMWKFLCETPERVPFTDMPFVSKPFMRSFIARTVQGGLYINMLKF